MNHLPAAIPDRCLQVYRVTHYKLTTEKVELKIININEDRANEIYSSTDCQQVIAAMDEFYPKMGFNRPWVGYFVFKNNQVVGTGGFTGQPKDGKIKYKITTKSPTEFRPPKPLLIVNYSRLFQRPALLAAILLLGAGFASKTRIYPNTSNFYFKVAYLLLIFAL